MTEIILALLALPAVQMLITNHLTLLLLVALGGGWWWGRERFREHRQMLEAHAAADENLNVRVQSLETKTDRLLSALDRIDGKVDFVTQHLLEHRQSEKTT